MGSEEVAKVGDVISVKIVLGRQTRQARGIVFVEMSKQWEARRAVSMLNGTDLMGKNLNDRKRGSMNKARLDWVMSGLNQHALTKAEYQFLKTTQDNFDKKQVLTDPQEKRLETLYKEKSLLAPNKKSPNYYSFKENTPKKGRPRKLIAKDVLIAS